ncbi:MAG: beta-ketoacyl-ACP synthase II [Defluviitaleaceae bacterium]|nr:beta-ketoacyl-ACP synthase II [Defluviitaleaceae bacterium]
MKHRVVVTGMGVISSIGQDIPTFTDNLRNGVIGIKPITKVQVPESPVKLASEVQDYDPEPEIAKKDAKRMDTFTQYALSAAAQAMEQSGLDLDNIDKKRLGVIIGTGIGGMETFETEVVKMYEKGGIRIAPLFIPMMIGNMAAGMVAIRYGAKGVCTNVVTACASSSNTIGEAFRSIRHGYSDVIIAGGTEATVTRATVAGFNALKAISQADDPLRASIPFDAERNGFILGEGAGILVLENYEKAKARGAKILAEIVGYGTNCDAHHMTAPTPDGQGAADCMTLAVEDAELDPTAIDYINAHGTSTPLNDAAETAAIKRAFGTHAVNLLVSSTKSQIGHLLGAAGAVEAIATISAMLEGFVPPTMGLKKPDPECDLNYVPNAAIDKQINYALSNNFGFGGHNATICIKRWEE